LIIAHHFLILFLIPLAISFVITGLMIRWAPALGLVDIPNERKVHTRPIPKGGGLGIFLGWVIGDLMPGTDIEDWFFMTALGAVVVVLGLVDDVRPLPWQLRLGVQTFVAAVALFPMGTMASIGASQTPTYFFYLLWPLGLIWIVGLTNAFNMLDNMDALSGGVAWIVAGLLALFAMTGPGGFPPFIMLMGAVSGFLWFNRPRARIFMGDAGSTFLGFFLGTASWAVVMHGEPKYWPMILSFLAIPWYDLVSVVIIRLRQGRSPFHADKQHLSHRLVALGLTPPRAVATICLLAAAIAGGGLLLSFTPDYGSLLTWIFVPVSCLSLAAFELFAHRRLKASVEA
jgi:UDP-GlcNAc:undecaprenyl-phosphate GlcNAc-1-phosphate transferase